jgi:hypothetical protein
MVGHGANLDGYRLVEYRLSPKVIVSQALEQKPERPVTLAFAIDFLSNVSCQFRGWLVSVLVELAKP